MSCAFYCHISRVFAFYWASEMKAFPIPLPFFQDRDRVTFVSWFPWRRCSAHSGSPINVYGIERNGFKGHKTDAKKCSVKFNCLSHTEWTTAMLGLESVLLNPARWTFHAAVLQYCWFQNQSLSGLHGSQKKFIVYIVFKNSLHLPWPLQSIAVAVCCVV